MLANRATPSQIFGYQLAFDGVIDSILISEECPVKCANCKELEKQVVELQQRLNDALTLLMKGELLRDRMMLESILRREG